MKKWLTYYLPYCSTHLQHHAGSGAHLMPGRSGCRTATPGGPSWVRTCKRRGWVPVVGGLCCMIWYEKLFPRKLRCPLKKKVGGLYTFLVNWPLLKADMRSSFREYTNGWKLKIICSKRYILHFKPSWLWVPAVHGYRGFRLKFF